MTVHIPVLLDEVLEALEPEPGKTFVDGTLGGCGHARVLAQKVGEEGLLIGIDRDPEAIERAEQALSGLSVKLVAANFSDIPEILKELEIDFVDGIVLDLGLSSDQLASDDRGFSFQSSGDFDLRFNRSLGEPAWKLVNRLSEKHLADLIYQFGEERLSRRVARAFVQTRQNRQLKSADEIAQIIRKVVPRSKNHSIDPATRTFQAFRIAVNEELKWIKVALKRLPLCLKPGGRLAVISFHSLEDKLVKQGFRENELLKVLNSKPIRPSENETEQNPRARSSRLRVAERI